MIELSISGISCKGRQNLKTALVTLVDIDGAHCSGCGRCIAACGLRLFAFEQRGWKKISVLQHSDRCNGCGKCAVHCPVDAITLRRKVAAEVECFALTCQPIA